VLTLPPRHRCPLTWLPASRLLLPRSGLERSDFVHWGNAGSGRRVVKKMRLTRASRSTSVQVIKRHRCAGFVCLYDDVAFYLPNDRHAEQTVEQEPLVVSEICHHDL
jgi:hypothetical protein